MFARSTFSITVPKCGEERWIFSQNNQCENGKNFGVGDLYTFLYLYKHNFIYDTYEKIIDFKI